MLEKLTVISIFVSMFVAIAYYMLKNTLFKDLQGIRSSIDSDNRKFISAHIRKKLS